MRKLPAIRKPRRFPFPEEYRFLGLDEAGRGPVIGPMVISICALTKRDLTWCIKHGVKDSKLLSPKRRDMLARALQERCWSKSAIIHPPEIDAAVLNRSLNLNGLEFKHMAELIVLFKQEHLDTPGEIMLDSPVRGLKKFRDLMCYMAGWDDLNTLKAENKADARYLHVGAASIIAKSIRDSYVRKIIFEVGDNVGSGYASDELARAYVLKAPPNDPNVRWSWSTCEKIRQGNNKLIEPLL